MTVAPWTLEIDRAAEEDLSREAVARRLYVELGLPVRAFLVGMVGVAAVEDAVQETFTRAFAHDELPPAAERRPWIYGIARNVAREALRARQRSPLAPADPPDVVERGACPEATAIARQTARRVAGAIAALGEDRRAALLLRVQQGLSCDEIAIALGWTVAKVKIEVFRAREALRAAADRGRDA